MKLLKKNGKFVKQAGGGFLTQHGSDCCCAPCDYIRCTDNGECPCCNFPCGVGFHLHIDFGGCVFANLDMDIPGGMVCTDGDNGVGSRTMTYAVLSGEMNGSYCDPGLLWNYNLSIGCSANITDGDCLPPTYGWIAAFDTFLECPASGLTIFSGTMTLGSAVVECSGTFPTVTVTGFLTIGPLAFNSSDDSCCDVADLPDLCDSVPITITLTPL